ncbi:hypothetical protein GCM10027030_08690 [Luteococcus sediminum]
MGARQTRPVLPTDLAGLDIDCPRSPGLRTVLTDAHAAWAHAAMQAWGLCGMRSEQGSVVLVCPALHLPAGHPLQQWSRPAGAAHVLALSVAGDGLSGQVPTRWLVQSLARRLRGRASGLEAAGSRSGGMGDCTAAPAAWLEGAGFVVVEGSRGDGLVHLQLDLGRTVPWARGAELARRAAGRLLPSPWGRPEPTGRDLARREG